MILASNFLSVACISFLIFVHWKKGPKCWLKFSHYIFYVVLLLNYLIIPAINIIVCTFLFINPNWDLKAQTAESYVLFFFAVCCMRVVEYFTMVRRTVVLDARIYVESRREFEALEQNELQSRMESLLGEQGDASRSRANTIREILNETSYESYRDRPRGYGQGDVRLGKHLDMDDSIYSLGFLA